MPDRPTVRPARTTSARRKSTRTSPNAYVPSPPGADGPAPSKQRLHAREELRHVERLHQIVVRAELEPTTRSTTWARAVSISTGTVRPLARSSRHTS